MERHLSMGSGLVDVWGRGCGQVIGEKQRLEKIGLVEARKAAGRGFSGRTI